MIAGPCRECGITKIPSGDGIVEVDGVVLCWADDDLCSLCQERLQAELERDAARYRHLRNRQTRKVDIAAGGGFIMVPANLIPGGEDLDRMIDAEMGADVPEVTPLEERLAECLADIVDTPLLTGTVEHHTTEIRLGFFRPDAAERAAVLLEEAGK